MTLRTFRYDLISLLTMAALAGVAPHALSQPALSQPSYTFGITDSNGNAAQLVAGASINFPPTSLGTVSSVTVSITNASGSAPGLLDGVSISGSAFQLSGTPFPGTSIAGGSTVSFTVKFMSTQLAPAQGTLLINLQELNATFALTGSGTGPLFTYTVQQGSTTATLSPSQTIAFPATQIGQTSVATVTVVNSGNAAGQIASIAILGAAYQLLNPPFLPVSLPVNGSIVFQISFSPTQPGAAQGRLQIGSDMFNLTGNALGASFAFSYTTAGNAVPLPSNGTIVFRPTAVGASSASTVSITNQGTAAGLITSIGVGGSTGIFGLLNLPALPLMLTPGASVSFIVTFTPAAAGVTTANLVIDTLSFTLSGTGTTSGSGLAFSYTTSAGPVAIPNNGTVVFNPAAIGATSTATFMVTNQSAAAATVNAISVTGSTSSTNTGFTLSGLPPLPATLAAGAALNFTINFVPNSLGAATATLNIDAQSFTLSASGTLPAPLPSYTFTGATGVQNPLTQPAVGLTLQSPYALPVTGMLTLTFLSDAFSDDPAIEFSTGSRSVGFTIPANSTSAVFSNGATQINFATGSVAGTISMTPSFATAGGASLTPASPLQLNLTVPESAPGLLSAQVASTSSTGFTLSVTGYATGRNLSQIAFHFNLAAGATVSIPDITLNVEPQFTTWYQGSASQPFGSLFTVSIPFTLSGQAQGFANPVDAIQSVAITLTNLQGSSSPQAVPLQ